MPPEIRRVPLPITRGKDAADYLEAHGIVAVEPSIRSSDAGAACEFQYYLGRRLGLAPLYAYRECFSVGGWAHKYLQMWYLPDRDAQYEALIREEMRGVESISEVVLPPPGWIEEQKKKIQRDAQYARSLMLAGFNLAIRHPSGGSISSLILSRYQPIDHELVLRVPPPDEARCKGPGDLLVQLDILHYDESTHRLWITDAKTTSAPPLVRAEMCGVEFQTWMYLDATKRSIPALIEKYNLPSDTQLAGMIHPIVQKPGIRMTAAKDCDFRFEPHVLLRGPRKGTTEMRRVKESDEPRWENFLRRLVSYMTGEGEYQDKHIERLNNPMANIHYTPIESIPDTDWEEYYKTVNYIWSLAHRKPYPENFRRNAHCMLDHSNLTPFAPFYKLPVAAWPAQIKASNLIVRPRD